MELQRASVIARWSAARCDSRSGCRKLPHPRRPSCPCPSRSQGGSMALFGEVPPGLAATAAFGYPGSANLAALDADPEMLVLRVGELLR